MFQHTASLNLIGANGENGPIASLFIAFFPPSFLLINLINLAVGAQQEPEHCVLIDRHVTKIIGQWGWDGSCDSFSLPSLNKVSPLISALGLGTDKWGASDTEGERESSLKNYEQSSHDLFITERFIFGICLDAPSLVVGKEDMDEYFAICSPPRIHPTPPPPPCSGPDNSLRLVEVVPHIQSAESIPETVIHALDPSAANGNN